MITWSAVDPVSPFGRLKEVNELIELFHEQTKTTTYGLTAQIIKSTREADRPENRFRNSLNYKLYAEHKAFPLPKPVDHSIKLVDAFRSRRSDRAFSGTPVSIQDISDVVLPSLESHRQAEGVSLEIGRPYPSGGAMYPVEHYVLVCNVDGLSRGAYYVNLRDRDLRLVMDIESFEQLETCFTSIPGWLAQTGFVVVQTALLERSAVKYGPRGYRLALIEAGCAAQNLLLACAAKDLSAVMWAGFIDDKLAHLLRINPLDELVLMTMIVGNRSLPDTNVSE